MDNNKPKYSPLKCRFCDFVSPLSKKSGQPSWARLKKHISDEHEDKADQIHEHVAKTTSEPQNLAHYAPRRAATLGKEFRTRLGYGTATQGAEQRNDGNNDDD